MLGKDKMTTFWDDFDPSENKKAELFLNMLIENRKNARTKYFRAFYLLIIFFTSYYLLHTGAIKEVSVLSITMENTYLLKWGLMVVCSFILYSGISIQNSETHLAYLIESYFKKHVPKIGESQIMELYKAASFINFEAFVSRLTSGTGALLFLIFILILFLAIPILLQFYIIAVNVMEWNMVDSTLVKLSLLLVTTIFFSRALWLLKFTFSSGD